ncbi:hypothetical protein Agub_g4665 [Astrephomene gubernaculifera]|uniref:Uncharacterized protein n=1 Tax=Astrephomene gubernaculifera TaxID=47775 RepID=A0AAD3DKK6_9CHLO|nr:hypothetical protein Agub_g4665 [Astrephomene gubernaculifera]
MVFTTTPAVEPERKRPAAATTTAEAKANKAPYLCLSSLKLIQIPEDVSQLKSLTNLDLSNNHISSIPEKCLPSSLVELTLTGCQLTELPNCIGTLPRLKKLYAGANRLQHVEPVFRSTSLQHVGLSYNRVSYLPGELLPTSPLMSLDLSHNDLEGLVNTLVQLSWLPSLAALSLAGNPLALVPRYAAEARGRLKQLMFLDGQRLDLPPSSRPGTANSSVAAAAAAAAASSSFHGPGSPTPGGGSSSHGSGPSLQHGGPGGSSLILRAAGRTLGRSISASASAHQTVRFDESNGGGGGGEGAILTLTLGAVRPAEDPFGWLRARWAEQIATAEELGLTSPPALEQPDPPLQPVIYHVELQDMEGTPLSCLPLKLSPPDPPDVTAMFDPKAKQAAAAAAAREAKKASKPTSGRAKSGKGSKSGASGGGAEDPSASPQAGGGGQRSRGAEGGWMRVKLPLPATVECRNWLRSGFTLQLYRTTLTAVPRSPSPTSGASSPSPSPGAKSPAPEEPAGGTRANTASSNPARKGKKKNEEPPPPNYDVTGTTELLGTALLRAGAQLVDGYSGEAAERLDFTPPPALWDERGLRMGLRDPRHPVQVVGHAEVRLQLQTAAAAGVVLGPGGIMMAGGGEG